MSIDYTALKDEPRLLMEAELRPLQGERFQPTGFADLGPARYTLHDGTQKLLVESAQSVANRMESTIWDEENQDLISELKGLPYIQVNESGSGESLTNSILEAHRINSEYIMKFEGKKPSEFSKKLESEIAYSKDRPIDRDRFVKSIFKYDPNSVLHGCFLEEIAGRLRLTRVISGLIEASEVSEAESGGVKNNHVEPGITGGGGNVPFHRTEFTAPDIKAFFNLDLSLLRSYGLGENETRFLISLALYKIRKLLNTGLRLRTACDFELVGDVKIIRPKEGFSLAPEKALLEEASTLIPKCKSSFAEQPITHVERKIAAKKNTSNEAENES